MWAYIKDNKIEEIIRFPKAMVIDGVKHPRQIFTVMDCLRKKKL